MNDGMSPNVSSVCQFKIIGKTSFTKVLKIRCVIGDLTSENCEDEV